MKTCKKNSPTYTIILIFFVVLVSNTILIPLLLVESCDPIDKEALLEFKRGIQDNWFQRLGTWVPQTDCCTTWDDVTCDPATGRVVKISLIGFWDEFGVDTAYGMEGTISPFVGNLTHLQIFNLRALAGISGPIPSELGNEIPLDIGKLKHLTRIDLSYNHIYGSIPTSIGKLSQLQALLLPYNNLSGSIPTSITQLSQLQDLHLDHNQLTGVIPTSVGKLSLLQNLFLDHNKLNGTIPSSIGNLKHLQVLEMVSNRLSGRIPKQLGNAKELKRVLLSRNRLNGSIPSKVLNLEKLQVFDVSRNQLSGEIPAHNLSIPASAFSRNLGLCGAPLPPCKRL
ncbi:hypothetical protein RDABS01_005978 [Bienertia sinuspersici]